MHLVCVCGGGCHREKATGSRDGVILRFHACFRRVVVEICCFEKSDHSSGERWMLAGMFARRQSEKKRCA